MPKPYLLTAEYLALKSAREAFVEAKRNLRDEIERQFEAVLANKRETVNTRAAEAFRAGIPKSAIGRAMGTSNWDTIQNAIETGLALNPEAAKPEFWFASITGSSRDAVYAVVQTGDDETWTHDVMGEVTGYLLGFAENSDSELELALNPIAHRAPTDVIDWAKNNIEQAWSEREVGDE